MTYQHIYNIIKKKAYFDAHQAVLIAVSGGVDSMNLLHFLHAFQAELQIRIGIAHVNHKQRPESDDEEAYLRSWAKKHAIPIYVAYFQGAFSENAARHFRYQFFEEIMQQEHYSALVTAHHADDQAETILMRLIRGSRLRHLAGIREVQSFANGQLIRPFLTVPKAELPNPFHFEDHSNDSMAYFRNRVRHHYLPDFKRENPQATQSLIDLSAESRLLLQAFDDLTKGFEFHRLDCFLAQSAAVQFFLLQHYLETFPQLAIKKSQFDDLLHIIRRQKQGFYPIKNTYCLLIEKESFAIKKIIPKTDLNREFKMVSYGDSLNYRGYRFAFSGDLTDKGHDIAIPLYGLSPVTLRHRQAGDSLFLGEFSKKLRRLFIDGKFTSEQRQNAIVGEQAGVIIFVLVGDETYLRKVSKHDIMLAKLYIDKLEKR